MTGNNFLFGLVITAILLTCVPASAASDYTLDIFGNANEDDTIDLKDVEYTASVVLGLDDQTQLADAKYDGEIDILDVTQIELIILGREKEMTFLDIFDEAVTVNKPIKRLVNMGWYGVDMARTLGARDILVAVGVVDYSEKPAFYPEIGKLPIVAPGNEPDFEKILSLNPDAVQVNIEDISHVLSGGKEKKEMYKEKLPGIPIICLNMREPTVLPSSLRVYGHILDRENEAEEFIEWFEGYGSKFKARTEGLSKDEKPKVWIWWWGSGRYSCNCPGNRVDQALVIAGGRNIAEEIIGPDHPKYGGYSVDVESEWMIEQNPAYIIGLAWGSMAGYATDDPSKMASSVEELLSRPELAKTDAVKNKHVYSMEATLIGGGGAYPIGIAYMAKLLHPDLFMDIDPEAIHQEYVDKFCYVDFNVKEQGAFVYPPFEEWP
ncbi:ABC transporter substrate-binding protein [Methanococcoides sp.]|uniref:ABC transporter substrate-binding protein n=1 Tax=Methanococcoides sp. TaxID=1966350 RepID=UPI00272E4257|nr:ABC transporter substrate-binding protein [Methanococcoides sp.]